MKKGALALLLAAVLCLSGCAGQGKTDQTLPEEQAQPVTQPEEEIQTLPQPEPEEEEPSSDDPEWLEGQEYDFIWEDEELAVQVCELNYYEATNYYFMQLKVKTPEETVDAIGYYTQEEEHGTVEPAIYAGKRLFLDRVDEEEGPVFRVEEYPTSVPLVLSGNREDAFTTQQPQYIETDRFVLYLPQGVTVSGDTETVISNVLDRIEAESGMTFYNDNPYQIMGSNDLRNFFYGPDLFLDINPDFGKIEIVVIPLEQGEPCASGRTIVVNPEDLDFDSEGFALIHELCHVIHACNGPSTDRIMTEGYATYLTEQVIHEVEGIHTDFNSYENYSAPRDYITSRNAEALFFEEKEDGWDNYLYGYRFLTFLHENYGEDFFCRYLDGLAALHENIWDPGTPEQSAQVIRDLTEEDVFVRFGQWLEGQGDRFSPWN